MGRSIFLYAVFSRRVLDMIPKMTTKEICKALLLYTAVCISGIFYLVFGIIKVIVTLPWRHK